MGNSNALASKLKMPSFQEKVQIVNAFLQCDYMSDENSRKTILNALHGAFPDIVDTIPVSRDNKTHVMNILNTCLKHDLGSLDALVEIVAYFDGEKSTPVQALRKVMHDIFFEDPIVGQELFDELIKVTARLRIARTDL